MSIFKAIAHPIRRRVLQLLRDGPLTAGELAGAFAVSKPTMSKHFALLREAGLVSVEKQGRELVYQLETSVLEEALAAFAESVGLTEPTTNEEVST
ncbi:MAG: metalloregulator ArsR/SmtB family transcription factor [Myxococcales bacterium]|nr:metalloregulator ArsR/SmtB family transcription factor [Myxococcales bacterium]